MVLFRQINTPKPESWASGRQWFIEDYDGGRLTSMWVIRQVLAPPVIQVQSILRGKDKSHSEILKAIQDKWPTFKVDFVGEVEEDEAAGREGVAVVA